MPGRVLMIEYYYPPLAGIASIRAMKVARYLPEAGWAPTVLAPRGSPQPEDLSLATDRAPVVRATTLEVGRLRRRDGSAGATAAADGGAAGATNLLRSFLHRRLYRPDAQIGWYPFALYSARRLLKEERFDRIVSSSFPITAHLVAKRLHGETGIPWVAEFRDPWADVTGDAGRERIELAILRTATAVVTVSPVLRDRFLEKGARAAHVITNGFDPEDLSFGTAEGIVVTHLGSVYPELQDFGCLWDALGRLRAEDPARPLRVRFVGELPRATRDAMAARGLDDVIEVTGRIGHREALAHTAASSVLIASGFHERHPQYRGVIPAKLFEYLPTGLPIIHVDHDGTDAAQLLSAFPGCHVVSPGDADGALRALRTAIAGGAAPRGDLSAFTRRSLARELGRVLDGMDL